MKARKIAAIVFTVLAVGISALSGVFKLTGGEEVATKLGQMGVADYAIVFGLMEISFAALFAFPKTMKIGFILLSCYFAGAMATELSRGSSLNALTPIVLVWIAAFLRDSSIFLPMERSKALI